MGINCKELVTPFIIEKVQEKYLSISCFLVFFSSNNFWNYNFKNNRKICQLYSIEKWINKLGGLVLGIIKISTFLVIAVSILKTWDSQSIK